MSLLALGPLALLILEKIALNLRVYRYVIWDYALSDLSDPIFTAITLLLFMSAIFFTRFWRPNISRGFQSIIDNGIINVDDGESVGQYSRFLDKYREDLHSKSRYFASAGTVIFGLALVAVITFGRKDFWVYAGYSDTVEMGLTIAHVMTRWVLSICAWGYFAGLALRAIVITHNAIRTLVKDYKLTPQPYHSDRVGGLGQIGELIGFTALFLFITIIPLTVLGLPRTIAAIKSMPCGKSIHSAASSEVWIGKDALVSCVVNIDFALGYSPVSAQEVIDDFVNLEARGMTPLQIVQGLDNELSDVMEYREVETFPSLIFNANSIYFFLILVALIVIFLLIPLAVTPFREIHQVMLREKILQENALNDRSVSLYRNLTRQTANKKVEDAGKTREELKKISDALQEVSKYPTWPINMQRLVQIVFSPTIGTTILTYALKQVNVVLSESTTSIFKEIMEKL
jgi:hypothetical protein